MKQTDKLDLIGYIDNEFIEKADNYKSNKIKYSRVIFTMAACMCVVIGCVIFFGNNSPKTPEGSVSEKHYQDGCTDIMSHIDINGKSYYPGANITVKNELPEGFDYAGEADLGWDKPCKYYINTDAPECIYVYQEVTTNGKTDASNTMINTEPHFAYLRYVDIRLRGKSIVKYNSSYYISMWSADDYSDTPDVTEEYYNSVFNIYDVRIEGEAPEGFEFVGKTDFSGDETVPKDNMTSNKGKLDLFADPDNPDIILLSTEWYTHTSTEKKETLHKGFDVYIKYQCPFE